MNLPSAGMPILGNPRHERFAQLVASGKHSVMEAFKQAGYADESAHQNACRLRANESVAARIEELRARNAEKCQLSRDEAVQYLVEILKTLIGEVTADHRLGSPTTRRAARSNFPTSSARCNCLPKCVDGTSPRSTSSSMVSRRGRNSLKSSLGCEDVERYAMISVPDKLPAIRRS